MVRWGLLLVCLAGAGWPRGGTDAEGWPTDGDTTVWTSSPGLDALSSPVVWKDRVYVTVEPHGLAALDLGTGEVRWTRTHGLGEVVSGDALAAFEGREAEVARLETEVRELRKEMGALRRASRRGNGKPERMKTMREVVVTTREGELLRVSTAPPYAVVARHEIPASVAVPAFVEGGVVLRGPEGVERRGAGKLRDEMEEP